MNLAQTDQIANRDRLFLLILTIPIAVLSLGALLIPEPFAHLIGAVGTASYVYRLVGAAALGYAGAIAWALRSDRWSRVRLLAVSLLGFSVAGVLGAILQLLIGDTKGIVYLILVLGLLVAAFTAYLLYKHRGWVQPVPNIHNWLVIFFIVATLVAVPFAIMPLFFPAAFAQLFSFQANDLLLYRLGGAELTGYVALGILEVQSRDMAEIHPAAIMVFFFNAMAVVASLLALFTGERSSLIYVVIVVSGTIAVLTVLELSRRTGGDLFGDREFAPQTSQ